MKREVPGLSQQIDHSQHHCCWVVTVLELSQSPLSELFRLVGGERSLALAEIKKVNRMAAAVNGEFPAHFFSEA